MNTSWSILAIARLSILSLTLAFSGVGVGSSQVEAPVADTAPVTFVASDYAFSGPDRLPGGLTTVRLINRGQDLHQLQFIKLPDNKTAADFMAELADNPSRLPSWAQRRGGPNSVIPGEQAVAMINLEPGLYIVLCGIPDAQNRPHVLLGMQTSLRVDAPVTSASPPPHSDLTMTLVDFGFELSKPLKAGKQMIHVVNRGSQPHEVVIVRLARGASVADFLDRFLPGVPILPAGKPIGGITGLEPGRDAFFRGDFAPGRYGLICFLPDVTTRGPHFARGMMMDVTVE